MVKLSRLLVVLHPLAYGEFVLTTTRLPMVWETFLERLVYPACDCWLTGYVAWWVIYQAKDLPTQQDVKGGDGPLLAGEVHKTP